MSDASSSTISLEVAVLLRMSAPSPVKKGNRTHRRLNIKTEPMNVKWSMKTSGSLRVIAVNNRLACGLAGRVQADPDQFCFSLLPVQRAALPSCSCCSPTFHGEPPGKWKTTKWVPQQATRKLWRGSSHWLVQPLPVLANQSNSSVSWTYRSHRRGLMLFLGSAPHASWI